ncbi:hypothetical protein [Pleionea sediminis]|uniref:hypothetical protein n=1 Tax=Pleionea sediminis TaxID=2569479 RepID=UPI001184C82B|nr:hypothetical protein [Pleionea sediminis]
MTKNIQYCRGFRHLILLSILSFCVLPLLADSEQEDKPLELSCQDFEWQDVEELVRPHLDDTLYTALVMQGQSSEYRTSAAARQVIHESLPHVIQRILQALIDADC